MMNNTLKIFTLISGIAFLSMATLAYANDKKVQTVAKVDLNEYLGTWHEIVRKPLYFQKNRYIFKKNVITT